jgi:hypothetical protein
MQLDVKPLPFAITLALLESKPETISVQDWEAFEDVISLGLRYQFHLIPTLVADHIGRHFPTKGALSIFAFASKYDFPTLAKRAVSALGSSPIGTSTAANVDPAALRDVTTIYAVALVQAMAKHPVEYQSCLLPQVDWKAVSGSFELKRK